MTYAAGVFSRRLQLVRGSVFRLRNPTVYHARNVRIPHRHPYLGNLRCYSCPLCTGRVRCCPFYVRNAS